MFRIVALLEVSLLGMRHRALMVKSDFSCIPCYLLDTLLICILISGQTCDPTHHSATHEVVWRQDRRHYVVLMCCSLSAVVIFNYAVSTPLPLCLLCATAECHRKQPLTGSRLKDLNLRSFKESEESHSLSLSWCFKIILMHLAKVALADSFMIY